MLARAYDDPELLAKILEATDSDIRSVAGAMNRAGGCYRDVAGVTPDR